MQSPSAPTRASQSPIPLTVIGGFLGAGKTSLINAVLSRSAGPRLAVLVNDFGALSIDAALISSKSARTVALTNGCVCCTLVSGLAQALLDVLRLDPPPDHVLVEASGVGDPRRIAQVARADPGFAEDATIVLVAADQIEALAADRYVGDTVMKQLASADILVLNKRDLVDAADARRIGAWLRGLSPRAHVVGAVGAALPCDIVLGPQRAAERRRDLDVEETTPRHADHGEAFASRTLRSTQPACERTLRRALDALPDAVLRAKGLVRFDESPQDVRLVQAVGRRWSISPAPPQASVAESALVIVGPAQALASADLSALEAAFAPARSSGCAFSGS
jgi:G3E family GTPase